MTADLKLNERTKSVHPNFGLHSALLTYTAFTIHPFFLTTSVSLASDISELKSTAEANKEASQKVLHVKSEAESH